MAFATTNVRKGTAGDLKITAGNWTGAQADAAGTIGVEGSQIYLAIFTTNDTSSPGQGMVPYNWTTTGGVSTLSVNNRETVTGGTFIIIHA